MTRILVVDDEANIVELEKFYLGREGYLVESAASVRGVLARFTSFNPDLIVLDIMLPDMDGLEICRQIRTKSAVPILMSSARQEDVYRIVGLELGADDYLTKPFNPHEMVARVKAILRRSKAEPAQPQNIEFGKISIDLARHEVSVDGNQVSLRAKEFALLVVFAQNPVNSAPKENYPTLEYSCVSRVSHQLKTHGYSPTLGTASRRVERMALITQRMLNHVCFIYPSTTVINLSLSGGVKFGDLLKAM